jgi:hypothetical protein
VRSATAMSFVPLPRLVVPTPSPLVGDDKSAVDEPCAQIALATLAQIRGQRLQHLAQRASARPLLESAVAGLVRWNTLGQILPARATAPNPEDPVEDLTRIPPGAAAPVGAARRFGNQRCEKSPWFVRECFSSCHTPDRNTAPGGFMRPLLVNRGQSDVMTGFSNAIVS